MLNRNTGNFHFDYLLFFPAGVPHDLSITLGMLSSKTRDAIFFHKHKSYKQSKVVFTDTIGLRRVWNRVHPQMQNHSHPLFSRTGAGFFISDDHHRVLNSRSIIVLVLYQLRSCRWCNFRPLIFSFFFSPRIAFLNSCEEDEDEAMCMTLVVPQSQSLKVRSIEESKKGSVK